MTLDFENVAMDAMRDYLAGGALETELLAIEAAVGGGYQMPRPEEIYVGFRPDDNRNVIQVFAEGGDSRGEGAGHRHNLADVRLVVAIAYIGGGQDPSTEERLMWRYVQAIRRAVRADYRLGTGGTTVKYAAWESTGRDFQLTDDATTHHARAIVFDVGVEDP